MQLTGDGVVTLVALSGTLSSTYRFRPGDGLEIGRSQDVALSINDRFASRRHCRLDMTPEGLILTDLGSANGTLLNGERVESAVLQSGDMIEIGSVELRVRIEQDIDDPSCGDCGEVLSSLPEVATPTLCTSCHVPGPQRLPDVDLKLRLAQEGYELLETLNRSGLRSVFRARRIAFRQPVIVKVLPLRGAVTRQQISRFVEGAHAQAPLRHRNISTVVDVRQCRDLLLLVTEEVEGETLRRKLQRGGSRLSVNESLRIAYQIGQALTHLYDHGVVHRDIRPDNVMITPDGTAKLIDFGVAKVLTQHDPYAKTSFGESIGMPGYMAPEQIHTALYADHRADIYGLGATLYHCLAGRPAAPTPTRGKALGEPAIQPLLEVPREAVELVLKLVQPKPQDRLQTPHALLGSIEDLVGRMLGVAVDASNVELMLRLGDPEADLLLTPPQAFRLQPASFQGRIRDQELVEFMQMLEFHGKSGTLTVRAESLQVEISIGDGRIVEVRGVEEGDQRQVITDLLALRDGAFGFRPHLVAVNDERATLRIGHLLLDHLRTTDEATL